MARTSSYYLYEKFEKRGDQDWIPSYPNVYSKDGDGTMPLVVRIARDEECGWHCDPEYQWVDVPISEGYVCDECEIDIDFRWVGTSAYTYIGDYRYEILQEQFRKDEGEWINTQNTKLGNPVKVGKKIKITFDNGDMFSQSCGSDDGVWHSYNSVGKYYSETAIQHESNKTELGDTTRFINLEDNLDEVYSIEFGDCVTELGWRYRNTRYIEPCTNPKCIDTGGGGGCGKSYWDNDVSTSGERMKNTYLESFAGLCIKEIIFPEGLRWIGGGSIFSSNKITALTIPSSVETIGYVRDWDTENPRTSCVSREGSGAFAGNFQLSNLSLNEGLKSIGVGDFSSCLSLERVDIPSTLEALGHNAFAGCVNLKQIVFKGETPPQMICYLDSEYYSWSCPNTTDLAVTDDTFIYIPCGSLEAYSQFLVDVPSDRIIEYGGNCSFIPPIASEYRPFYTYKIGETTHTWYRGLIDEPYVAISATTADFAMIDYADEINIPPYVLIPYDITLPPCGKLTIASNINGKASETCGFFANCDELVINTSAMLSYVNTNAKKVVIKQAANIINCFMGANTTLQGCYAGVSSYLEEVYIESNATLTAGGNGATFKYCTTLRDIYITYTGGTIAVESPSEQPLLGGSYPTVHVPCELYGRYKEHVFWGQFNIVKDDDSCVEPEIIFRMTSNGWGTINEQPGQFSGNTYRDNADVVFSYKNVGVNLRVRVCGEYGRAQYVTVYVDNEQVFEYPCYNTREGAVGWYTVAYSANSDGNEHTIRIVSHCSNSSAGPGNKFILTSV